MTRAALVTVALAVAAMSTACTGSSGPPDAVRTIEPGPQRSQLVAAAGLDPCPASSATAGGGGLPDVTLPCLGDGPAVHLAGLRGPLVVNIWGSWCVPCQRETPFLAEAHRDLKGQVAFLGVDTEDRPDSALDFAAHVQPRMRYPSVVDDDKAVLLGVHGPSAVPMTIFVDRNGRVVHLSIESYDSVDAVLADVTRYLGVRA